MPKAKFPDKNFKWTPELAYIIGLLTTDGNLSKDGRHIDFTSKDRKLVELFRECLHLNNKIGRKNSGSCLKKKYYRIQFGDVVFYRWLQKIGLSPCKTGLLDELEIPNKYFRDFLRGHLDGDGSIYTYRDYYNTFKNPKYIYQRLWATFLSASRNHIFWLRKNINKFLNIKGHFCYQRISKPNQTTDMYKLKFGKKDSIKLLSWLYYSPSIPCLIRKRKIAEKFI